MFGQPVGKPWYFHSLAHTEAVNRLLYVAEQGEPFVLLMAEHGVGKTTVLNQVRTQCSRVGHSVILLNVAALDEMSFLWQICGGLSITPSADQSRSEIMAAIRDELSGRALCNSRTVVILDDLHSATDDLGLMIQFMTAINQQTNGGLSIIAAAERHLSSEIQSLSALSVRLPLLDDVEAQSFVTGMLGHLNVPADRISEDGRAAIVNMAQGNPSHLARICELAEVATATDPALFVCAEVLDVLTNETLGV